MSLIGISSWGHEPGFTKTVSPTSLEIMNDAIGNTGKLDKIPVKDKRTSYR